MTILEALQGINAYPIPLRTLEEVTQRRGLSLENNYSNEILQSVEYNLAYADLLIWLSHAPQITQGGQSYSFTEEQRMHFQNRANELYGRYESGYKTQFGYKGSRL